MKCPDCGGRKLLKRYRRNASGKRRLPRRFREKQHIREEIEEGAYYRHMSFGRLRKLIIDYYKEVKGTPRYKGGRVSGALIDSFKNDLKIKGFDPLSPHEAVMADYHFYLLDKNSGRSDRRPILPYKDFPNSARNRRRKAVLA